MSLVWKRGVVENEADMRNSGVEDERVWSRFGLTGEKKSKKTVNKVLYYSKYEKQTIDQGNLYYLDDCLKSISKINDEIEILKDNFNNNNLSDDEIYDVKEKLVEKKYEIENIMNKSEYINGIKTLNRIVDNITNSFGFDSRVSRIGSVCDSTSPIKLKNNTQTLDSSPQPLLQFVGEEESKNETTELMINPYSLEIRNHYDEKINILKKNNEINIYLEELRVDLEKNIYFIGFKFNIKKKPTLINNFLNNTFNKFFLNNTKNKNNKILPLLSI